jgi:hypothetical protein
MNRIVAHFQDGRLMKGRKANKIDVAWLKDYTVKK